MTPIHSFDTLPKGGANPLVDGPTRRPSIPAWLKLIQEAVEASDFGTIQIKVHGGEVVQIETTRKIRVGSSAPRVSLHPTAPAEVNE